MNRQGNLWPELTSYSNLFRSAHKAARRKRSWPNVAQFLFQLEPEICRLQDELRQRTYTPGEYRTFQIQEPKPRLISAAPFRDRVVHHALCAVLEPIFERTFIHDSYACRRGKGTHAAVDRFTHFARRYRYVLKCDIRKFFPSIDHEVLKAQVARKIKDPDVLWLVNRLIDGSNPQEPVLMWFPGDDLLSPLEHRRGLPLGNQTSQFFANVFLNPFDHFVMEELRAPAYLRYVDDFALFSNDKRWLADAKNRCRDALGRRRLMLHPLKSHVSPVATGTRFLGYRVFPDHRLLVRDNVRRFRRRLKMLQKRFADSEMQLAEIGPRIVSWIAHAAHADTFRLRRRLFEDIVFRRPAVLVDQGSGR